MRIGAVTVPIAPESSDPVATTSKELEEPTGRLVGMVIEPLTAPVASAVGEPSGTDSADDATRATRGDDEWAANALVGRAESWIFAERAKCEAVTVTVPPGCTHRRDSMIDETRCCDGPLAGLVAFTDDDAA